MLVTNHPNREQYISPELLARTTEFQKLNPAQQRFVLHYVAKGFALGTYDAVAAVEFAYHPKKNIQIRAHQIMTNRHVRHVLDLHFNRSELDVLLIDLQRAVKKSGKIGTLTPQVAKALVAFTECVAKEKEWAAFHADHEQDMVAKGSGN